MNDETMHIVEEIRSSYARRLFNILSNAIKFTVAPGSVTLSVERTAVFEDQSTIKFVIKDTGIGMDKSFVCFGIR